MQQSALAFLLLAALDPAALSRAASGKWTNGGPDGGYVYSIAAATANPRFVYAGTSGGVFRSFDAAATWSGTSLVGVSVLTIAIDAVDPRIVYAGAIEGAFKSLDAGESWRAMDIGFSDVPVRWLAIAPSNPSMLYLGAAQFGTPISSPAGLYRSEDGGETWEGTTLTSGVTAIAIDPKDPSVVFAAAVAGYTANADRGIFKTVNGGGAWSPVLPFTCGPAFAAIAIDPLNSSNVYAVGGAFYKSSDAGVSWSGGSVGGSVLALDTQDPGVLYLGTATGVLRTRDAGQTWISLPGLAADVTALSVPTSETLYAGTRPSFPGPIVPASAVFKSSDGGSNWYPSDRGLSAVTITGITIDPTLSSQALITSMVGQVWETVDAGQSWSEIPTADTSDQIVALTRAPDSPSVLYAGELSQGSCKGVVKSLDGGQSWLATGLTTGCVTELLFDTGKPSVLYAATGAGVCKSTDSAASWTCSFDGGFLAYVFSLAIDPVSTNVLYAGTDDGVFRSLDSGAHWTAQNSGLPPWPFTTRCTSVAVSTSGSTVLVVVSGQVYRSADLAVSWQPVGSGLESVGALVLVADPSRGETFYVGTSAGVFTTEDLGSSWSSFGWGLPAAPVTVLAIDPAGRTLYAAVSAAGVWEYETPTDRPPLKPPMRPPRNPRLVRRG